MDDQELRYRALIATRMKALRELLGRVEPTTKNKHGYRINALSTRELAEAWDGLRENGITGSLIGSMERMDRHTTPMELRTIADALGLPRDYFTRKEPLSVVTTPPEAGAPPGPPDVLFHEPEGDRPKPDTGRDGHSHPGRDAGRDSG